MESWGFSLISAIIGGICTLLGGLLVYYRQSGAQTRQAASVLYYDLKSIDICDLTH